jgi:HlyD family secretion protein
MPMGRILGWSVALLIVAAALAWSFWPKPVPIDIAQVMRGPFQVTVEDEGRTRVKDAYVVSAPVAGRLLRIGNRAGESISAGDIVAQLQPATPELLDARARARAEATVKAAEAARNSAAAVLKEAQADVDHAEPELRRTESLATRGLTARMLLEDAQRQERLAVAALEAAKASLRVKEFELENARTLLADFRDSNAPAAISLKAPVSGSVFRVAQQSEAVIAAGTPIMEIGDPRDLEVMIELLSTDAAKVIPGSTALVTDWGGDSDLAAVVRMVEPSGFTKISALGVEEQRVRVILDIRESRSKWQQLGDGFRVNARIVVWQTGDTIRVPLGALFRNGNAWQTFVVKDGRAVRTNVTVGRSNDSDAQVLGGLLPGDKIIVHPSDQITDGTRVSVRPS